MSIINTYTVFSSEYFVEIIGTWHAVLGYYNIIHNQSNTNSCRIRRIKTNFTELQTDQLIYIDI